MLVRLVEKNPAGEIVRAFMFDKSEVIGYWYTKETTKKVNTTDELGKPTSFAKAIPTMVRIYFRRVRDPVDLSGDMAEQFLKQFTYKDGNAKPD